ncbi:helix-turn-helix transcriptional regulator [Myroides odoratimimus]|uniref:helix-turn-helix domain-containing protein n=1 Tax=Myroides TaxID=76831 RepID=UPI00057FD6A5|nr:MULTISPECIES: AraC family transcriptional regulator [Myroides]AJA70643.1 AraC-type DNA-binding domain-containing protein [Myroides sp. A21]MDM1327895.1 helix-turn-helix transcriptional regulator [Myroides odoratimimus]MDM1453615.1 helix-turn-helix transcriptional regulator [Myroides odoratimimus]MDM1466971.1 helix-turn-helix transcriptional regulator [Myroides odoratimimus]MDM1469839.1 helix-turn-helix transcriptional regulator [Myroides odoratimimus]
MTSKNTFDPIHITEHLLIDDVFSIQPKAHLTIVYIQKGKGMSLYEDHKVPFKKGKLFIIPFDTPYSFESKDGQILVIECPQSFIIQIRTEADRIETCDNINKLTYITHNYHTKAGCVFQSEEDAVFAEQLLLSIQREHNNHTQDYLIIRQCISILLNLVARNLILHDYEQVNENRKAQDIMKMITYIQQHIGHKEKLTLEALANEFSISKNYLGEYFKKQTGISLQDYILDYKLKLVETRLKYSNTRLKEIAFELGFNDESHLSKLFKKYKQMTPSQYKKEHQKV